MPLVTLTVRKPKTEAFKTKVLDAVHAALVSSGVPAADRFQRVIELDAEDFRFDLTYPDLKSERTDDFVLIEILWSVGRSVKVKRALLGQLMETLTRARPRCRERDGLFQGNVVGKLGVRRRPAHPHLIEAVPRQNPVSERLQAPKRVSVILAIGGRCATPRTPCPK